MANRNTQGFPSPEEDPRFHDTYQFLRRYRDATYSLKVVVHQMEHQFKLQYDNDIDKFLDSIYAAGADLTGSDIEQRAKSIARSNQMLKLLESSIDLLRKHVGKSPDFSGRNPTSVRTTAGNFVFLLFLSPNHRRFTQV